MTHNEWLKLEKPYRTPLTKIRERLAHAEENSERYLRKVGLYWGKYEATKAVRARLRKRLAEQEEMEQSHDT